MAGLYERWLSPDCFPAIRFSTLDALCRELKCQPGDLLEWVAEPEKEQL